MALKKHLEHLRKYYLEGKPEYLDAANPAASWVGYLKWISGACFVVAIAGTIGFSIWNLREARRMSEQNSQNIPLKEGRQADEHDSHVLWAKRRQPIEHDPSAVGPGSGNTAFTGSFCAYSTYPQNKK